MITCRECIENLKPDDPRVPVGRYHQSTCDCYCNKPIYYRELEKEKELPEQEKWTSNQWDIVNQLRSELRSWRVKYNETLNELAKYKAQKEEPF